MGVLHWDVDTTRCLLLHGVDVLALVDVVAAIDFAFELMSGSEMDVRFLSELPKVVSKGAFLPSVTFRGESPAKSLPLGEYCRSLRALLERTTTTF